MSAYTVRRALEHAKEQHATIPDRHHLESARNAALELHKLVRDGAGHTPRALTVALKLIDLLHIERLQAAAAMREERDRDRATIAGRARAAAADYDTATVRAWARANGVPCPARGRYLPEHIVTAWKAAQ